MTPKNTPPSWPCHDGNQCHGETMTPKKREKYVMGRRGRANLINESFFFVTTTVVKFTPVFKENRFCDILIDNIKYYQNKYQFSILGYVIMPTHFHWIVKTENKLGTISEIMRDIKKFTAWQIFELVKKNKMTDLNQIFRKEAEQISGQNMKLWM